MLYRREGFPEEGEVVLCTVNRINPNSVFVHIDDYDKQGMIHISEIAPGRIRNIRDYVMENKVIVCKVLSINRERGHIDLSLRRVNETLRRNKLDEVKQEQKAEKIIEVIAKDMKKDPLKVYEEVAKPVLEKYDMVHVAFADVAVGKTTLEQLEVPKDYRKELEEAIAKRFKPEKIPLGGILKLQSYAADGIEVVKKVLSDLEKIKNADIVYLGGGNYKIKIDSEDVKKDEKVLDQKIEEVLEFIKKHNGSGSFVKEVAAQ